MELLSAAEFISKLKVKLKGKDTDDAIAILQKQKINGKRATVLKTTDFFTMGILFGDALEIEEAIKEMVEEDGDQTLSNFDMSSDGPNGSTTRTSSDTTVLEGGIQNSNSTGKDTKVRTNRRKQTTPTKSLTSASEAYSFPDKDGLGLSASKAKSNADVKEKSGKTSEASLSNNLNTTMSNHIKDKSKPAEKRPVFLDNSSESKESTDNESDSSSVKPKRKSRREDRKRKTSSDESSSSESSSEEGSSSEKEVGGGSSTEDDEFDCLKKYFTVKEWNEMRKYEKSANLNLLDNYNKMKAYAVSNGKDPTKINMPPFMKPKKPTEVKKQVNNDPKSRKSTGNKENETPEVPNSKSLKRAGNKDNDTLKVQAMKSRRVPYVKKRKMSQAKCYGPVDMPESEYIEFLPEYDVEAVLNDAGDKLKKVRKLLKKDGIVFETDRKLMIRTLTKYLFWESVKNPKDVTQLHKEGLAASICVKWPKFKDESNSRYSWNVLFYRKKNSGFIANCVQNIYRSLDSTEKRRPRKDKTSREATASAGSSGATVIDPLVEHKWISLLPSNKFNHNEILTGMQDSFGDRRNWIMTKGPSITEIINAYVHLMSYGGEVLDNEFTLLQPGKSTCLLKEFPNLTASVKRITPLKEINDLDCEGIQVLLSLAELLPSPNILRKRGRSQKPAKASVQDILVTFTKVTDPKTLVASKRTEAAGKPVQPYILAFVPHQTILKMFLVCDSEMIEVKESNFLKGLDLLFKSYFVFNVDYPLAWTFVFQFLEHSAFKIDEDSLSITGKELVKRLSSG